MNNPNPMSAAEYWWNHLTLEQRKYIEKKFNDYHRDLTCNAENAFKLNNRCPWSHDQYWPETPQSTFTGV